MIISKIVEHNFSRYPEKYNNIADTQKKVAAKVADSVTKNLGKECTDLEMLEIGCGTGFLTRELMQRFPEADFSVTDISPAMLDFCKANMPPVKSANFAVCDITSECPEGTFDLITSSLAFQWVENMQELMKKLKGLLKPGGSLIFSTLTEGTFANIATIFKNHNIIFPMPKLLTLLELKEVASCFRELSVREEILTESYDSIKDFLDHIHHVGAGNATGEHLSVSDIRGIMRAEKNTKITVEYIVAFMECRKSK